MCSVHVSGLKSVESAHHSLPRPTGEQLLFHTSLINAHRAFPVPSQILGGDQAVLCSAARDPKTRKKGLYYAY